MKFLRNTSLFWLLVLLAAPVFAQNAPSSPADSAKGKIGTATVSVHYSSPSVRGRTIWGKLVPYNEVWRSGANEATTFTTDKPLMVEGKSLPAGTYAFFTIPGESSWTIIFNKVAKQWGAFKYDKAKDALRVVVKPLSASSASEHLKYVLTGKGLVLRWEKLEVPVMMKESASK